MHRKAGFTLAEIMTVAFLMLLVLYLIGITLLPSLIMFRIESAASDARQTVFLTMRRISRELSNSQMETVTIARDPSAIALLGCRQDQPFDPATGEPQFRNYFTIFYFEPMTSRVFTKRFPPDNLGLDLDFSQDKPPRLTPEQLKQICLNPNGTDRVIARQVEAFLISDASTPFDSSISPEILEAPLRVGLVSMVEVKSQGQPREERFELVRRVTPRSNRW